MSADNGCYILPTPELENGFFTGRKEYRVNVCQAIENITIHQDDPLIEGLPLGMLYAVMLFGDSPVFKTEEDALVYAEHLAEKFPYLEYGIAMLPEEVRYVFPSSISSEDAEDLINLYFAGFYDEEP